MASKILLRRNSTAAAQPTAAQIVPGELAINTADGRLFTELNNGTIVNLPVKSIEGQTISPSGVDVSGGTLRIYDAAQTQWKSITASVNNLTFSAVHGIFDYSIGLRGSRGSALGLESNATNGYLAIAAGGGEKIRITTAGDVGIGQTAPGSKLVVKGAGITSAASALNVTNSTDASLLFVRNDGNVGVGTNAPGYKLAVNGSFAATTKSFRIAHPSKPDHILEYGSLESPYHGVRLTGRGAVTESRGEVALPEYLKDLVHNDETLTIQITNYRHGKLLYVSAIDLQHDAFFVACDLSSDTPLEFFWSLTAVRKDVAPMVVEQGG